MPTKRIVNCPLLSALEIDEINRNCKELTPEEKLIHEETMRSL